MRALGSLVLLAGLAAAAPLPPLLNLPRTPVGHIDYSRDLLDPILCPVAGTALCHAQCELLRSGMTGACDANNQCVCADGQGPLRRQP